jgi:exodeoxyribonuclease VII small subunit
MKRPAEAKVEKVSFRAEIERLEEIVRALEANDVDLDRALKLFEDGVRSLSRARELLQQSELTVKRVLEEADGSFSTDRLDF